MQLDYPPVNPQLMQFLLNAFEAHGCSSALEGDWVNVEDGRLRLRAATFNQSEQPGLVILQADFVIVTPSGQHIIESFAGWGQDVAAALRDICEGFLDSTFHAVLSALLGKESEQAETLVWEISGIPRKLMFGSLRLRGSFPVDACPTVFDALEAVMKASDIERGLHWVRYFYSHVPSSDPVIEVLLDNEPWSVMQQEAANFPWPVSNEFYSYRLFFIVQDVESL